MGLEKLPSIYLSRIPPPIYDYVPVILLMFHSTVDPECKEPFAFVVKSLNHKSKGMLHIAMLRFYDDEGKNHKCNP